ncbi:hypothetical protein L1887_20128 [Cichorium endivia]|nr:hypothetical protein L1887_20128 [Cichorium endivia]
MPINTQAIETERPTQGKNEPSMKTLEPYIRSAMNQGSIRQELVLFKGARVIQKKGFNDADGDGKKKKTERVKRGRDEVRDETTHGLNR